MESEAPRVADDTRPDWEEILEESLACVHCGLCLSSCPTYRQTGRETSSPRGRIYLMRAAAQGRIEPDGLLAEEASLCLGCRACETACPAGVRYGRLVELTRSRVRRRGLLPRVEHLLLRHLIPRRARLSWAFDGLRVLQRTRLDALFGRLLPRRLQEARELLPVVPPRGKRGMPPEIVAPVGPRRGRVGFLAGCVMSELFADVNAATLRVLSRNGFEVVVPPTQGCCGALQAHAGDASFAAELAAHNASVFEAAGVDAVISNSAGCGAAMCDSAGWLADSGRWLAEHARDVSSFLDEQGWRAPLEPLPLRVCYDDPCHLVHAQGVEAAPRRLLQAIPQLELVSHADPGACCGAAGTYNLTQPEMAGAVLDAKLDSLAAADPDVVASGNPGCMMQLSAGLSRRGLRARVKHPVELLDESSGGGVRSAAPYS
ncbi:MAG: (Fe-S)-binding protein [Myxococcota bacterium]